VRLEVRPLAEACPPAQAAGPGLVVCNPPYGERLGAGGGLAERGEEGRGSEARWGGLRPLYTSLGDLLKRRFAGWRAYLLSGNAELTRYLGLRASHGWSVWNGPIPCRLLEYPIVAPDQARSARSPTGGESGERAGQSGSGGMCAGRPGRGLAESGERADPSSGGGAQAFGNRLRKNARHRERWARRQGITCYRLYDADIPEYAVAIDRYERWVLVQEYAPPADVDADAARRRLRQVLSLVPEVLGLSPADLRLKVRRRQTRGRRDGRRGSGGEGHEGPEGGHRLRVDHGGPHDTGLFLDHRQTRALIGELAAGRRFLNLFAYTGTATVYAAKGGATGTVSVDLSATHLDWARRNLVLNGLRGPRHELIRADCLEWLESSRQRFGLIFLDPPTFSNSKAMRGTLDVQRDHVALIRAAARLLAPGGLLLFSCNARRFRLAAGELGGLSVRDITRQSMPPDFARSPRAHHLFRIEVTRQNAGSAGRRGGPGPRCGARQASAARPGDRR
jgi:23S rRNA (guanine2445-N2)-methyltransferase / 23S rRNA (guanine2069-N7)-methyltransferase